MARGLAHALVAAAALAAAPARAATVCAPGATLQGVDVSATQGTIDWAQVAATKSFALVRATVGASAVDARFAANWAGARGAGLVRGAYHVFAPADDADAQADAFLAAIGTIEPGDLHPAVEVETMDALSASSAEIGLARFFARVEQAAGPPLVVRTDPAFWSGSMGGSTAFGAEPLWIVHPDVTCPDVPPAWATWTLWQWTRSGTSPGISGAVDLDRFNGGLAELDLLRIQAPCGAGGAPWTCAVPPEEPGGASCGCGGAAGAGADGIVGLALALVALRPRVRPGARGRRSRPRGRPSRGSARPRGARGRRAASG